MGFPSAVSKHLTPFEVFTNASPTYEQRACILGQPNPLRVVDQSRIPDPRPQLSVFSAPWLQPHNQSILQYAEPVFSRQKLVDHEDFPDVKPGEEDMPTSISTGQTTNPLVWRSPDHGGTQSFLTPEDSPFGGFFGLFSTTSHMEDPFVVTKNPLVDDMLSMHGEHDHIHIKQDSSFATNPLYGAMA
jgi:hypothetical protein